MAEIEELKMLLYENPLLSSFILVTITLNIVKAYSKLSICELKHQLLLIYEINFYYLFCIKYDKFYSLWM